MHEQSQLLLSISPLWMPFFSSATLKMFPFSFSSQPVMISYVLSQPPRLVWWALVLSKATWLSSRLGTFSTTSPGSAPIIFVTLSMALQTWLPPLPPNLLISSLSFNAGSPHSQPRSLCLCRCLLLCYSLPDPSVTQHPTTSFHMLHKSMQFESRPVLQPVSMTIVQSGIWNRYLPGLQGYK